MNLENLNLLELNALDAVDVNGGDDINYFWHTVGAILGVIGTVGNSINNHHNSEIATNFQAVTGGTKW